MLRLSSTIKLLFDSSPGTSGISPLSLIFVVTNSWRDEIGAFSKPVWKIGAGTPKQGPATGAAGVFCKTQGDGSLGVKRPWVDSLMKVSRSCILHEYVIRINKAD